MLTLKGDSERSHRCFIKRSPALFQAITQPSSGLLLTELSGTKFTEIVNKYKIFIQN